jgi:hypothetical protein
MKTFLQISLTIFVIGYLTVFPQVSDVENYQDIEPIKIFMNSHDPNLKSLPEKSFYKQKEDWQFIIDTTWGAGLPLAQKQQIFNTFTASMNNTFDGFQSLGMTWASWDSLKSYYYSKIDTTTSRGRFAAIMNYLCSEMRDGHTFANDNEVFNTPLNPGVPFFMFGGLINVKHLGAVTTVLPDSSVLVLRVVDNHPLNLEPGDIILGYEGVPWKDLIVELMEAELPNNDHWGGFTGTFSDHLFIGAGMNWHLFDTMDVLKYSTGDTVHLSVAPMVNLNVPPMLNNEQMEIPNIPFPNYFNGEIVTYGILNNTNIGYIYVLSEYPTAPAEQQFYQAIASLQNTDALIIDMRWNEGGWAAWQDAFKILSNQSIYTLQSAIRCSPSDFDLCPINNQGDYIISGSGPAKYDRPIAVLLGPNCLSDGDINAYRLRYLYNVRTFGKPTWASLGTAQLVNISGWFIVHSIWDAFPTNNPGYYLNRKEFPIDFPVWHNRDDVAQGKDAVVEKALDWINNLVYPHNTITDKLTYSPGEDSVHLSTIVENPNSHQISARAYLKTLEGVLIDSVNLVKQTLNPDGENWTASLNLPSTEEFYKIALTVFDETASDNFTVPNATRFTTAGPVTLDSVYVLDQSTYFFVKPLLKNQSTVKTITNASVRLICNDPWVTSILPSTRDLPDIPPSGVVGPSSMFRVDVDTTIFPDYFNFKVEITSGEWAYWIDSMRIPPVAMISINPTELDFGEVAMGSSATNTFTITNYGDENLVISNITSSEPVFTVNLTSAVILPDSSQEVEVTFTPTGALSFNGKIEITHNAAGSPDSVVVIGEGVIVGVEDELKPLTFSLEQNYPNPFNPSTTIKYSIPEASKVILKLYNLLGEEVATLVNEEKVAGYYMVEFNAVNLPSGVYFYRIQAGHFVQTRKMILMK